MRLLCFLQTVSGKRPSGEVLKPERFVGRLAGSGSRVQWPNYLDRWNEQTHRARDR
jgi:hypothetical protein